MTDRVRTLPVKVDQDGVFRAAEPRGLLSDLARKAADLVVRVLSLRSSEGWMGGGGDSHANEAVNESTVLSLSSAWACINLIAGVTGTLPFHVMRKSAQGVPEVVEGHWLERLLDQPNLDQTSVDMLEFVAACLEFRGNAYLEKRRLLAGGSIIALEPLYPDVMEVKRNGETGRLQYHFPGPRGEPRVLDQDDVWHIRGFGGGPLGGISTLAFGRHAFGLALAIDKSAGSTFRNGIKPSGILKFKDWLKPDKREAAHARLIADHGQAHQSGRPLVLEGGVEWQQISFSPQDSQMLQSRSFSVEDICRFFGVPPVLVGHTEKVSAWGSGIQEITLGFVKYALRRRLKRIEKSARQQLLSPQERAAGLYLRFDLRGLMRGDDKGRAEFYEIMSRIGAFDIDYIRSQEDLAPLPNGAGSLPRMQVQNVPLTSLEVSVPAPKPAAPRAGG